MRHINLIRNVANWPTYYAHKAGISGRDAIDFRLRGDVHINVPVRVLHEFKEVVFDECYTAAMPRPIPSGSDIIDIGANIGAFALFAMAKFPASRIMAFEPDSHNFGQLAKNAASNPTGRFTIDPRAVGASSGVTDFFRPGEDGFATGGSIVGTSLGAKKINVPIVGIAELFSEYEVRRCGLLKLDCEGAEFAILHAMPVDVLERIDQMVMEVHAPSEGGERSIAGVVAFLGSRGLKTKRGAHGLIWAWRP